jgi:hypothetical protein
MTKVILFYANYEYQIHLEPDLRGGDAGIPEVSEYVLALNNLYTDLWVEITYAQLAHSQQANKAHHPDPVLKPEDSIWLHQKYVKTTRLSGNLDYTLIGPYTI